MNRNVQVLVIAVTGIEILISFFIQSINYNSGLLLIGLIVLAAVLIASIVKKNYVFVGIFMTGIVVAAFILGSTWGVQISSGVMRFDAITISLILFACAIIVIFLALGIYMRLKSRKLLLETVKEF